MSVYGIDISLFQGDFNFKEALKSGVKYAIIKAGENYFTDPKYERNYKEAKAAGMPIGAYWLLHANDEAGVKREAKLFADALAGKQFEYPVFVDLEDGNLTKVSKDKLTDLVWLFCETMENYGYWCGFYTNLDWYTYKLNGPKLAERFSFWFAWFSGTMYDLPGVQMWQPGKKTIAGVETDYDYCFVDYPTLIKQKGKNGYGKTPAPAPAPTPEPKPAPAVWTPKVGDKVRIEKDAPVYGYTAKFAYWVYRTVYVLMELDGNRAVFGTEAGVCVGAVDKKYLKKA